MGQPDYDFPPGQEPEKLWPIDPRPALRDSQFIWSEEGRPRYAKPMTPQDRILGRFAFAALVVFVLVFVISNRKEDNELIPACVSGETLAQVEKGMSQKEVRELLGEPWRKKPDCWTYNFSEEQLVRIHFGSMFKVFEIERVNKRRGGSGR